MEIRTSPLVQMAEEARRPSRWWVGWPVALLIIVVGGAGGQALGTAVLGSPERMTRSTSSASSSASA